MLKETKELAKFVIALGLAAEKSYDDKKIDYSDAFNFWEPVTLLKDAAEDAHKIKEEWKNASEEDLDLFYAELTEEFDLKDDQIEEVVEKALEAGIALWEVFKALSRGQADA